MVVPVEDIGDIIAEVERILQYNFANKVNCAEALQMAGPTDLRSINGQAILIKKNDRLAVCGRLVLKAVISQMWYEFQGDQGRELSHREWKTIKQNLVSNAKLARHGLELGLGAYIIVAPGTTRVSNEMMATTMGALLGAVDRDSNANDLTAVQAVINTLRLHRHALLATL